MKPPPLPARIQLHGKVTVCLRAPRGLRLLNLGAPVLAQQAPLDDGGGMYAPHQRASCGETLVFERAGWVRLSASGNTELVCLDPVPSAWRRLLKACLRFLATSVRAHAHER